MSLNRLQRFHDGAEFLESALVLRIPVPHVHAIWNIEESETARRLCSFSEGGRHRVEQGQRQGGPHPAQKRAPLNRFASNHHFFAISFVKPDACGRDSPRRDSNGRLLTTACIRS
jgi:hypothetical protein